MAINSSYGNCPLSAVQSRLRSTDGVSHKSLLTATMHPARKLSFSALDPRSDSLLLGVSAVKLDAPPGLISGSPIFLFFKLASGSDVQSQHYLGILSHVRTCPECSGVCTIFFARLPLANSSFCWIVDPCCVLLAVAFHRLPTHRLRELQIPSTITFKTSHTACLHCTCWRQQEFIGAVHTSPNGTTSPV